MRSTSSGLQAPARWRRGSHEAVLFGLILAPPRPSVHRPSRSSALVDGLRRCSPHNSAMPIRWQTVSSFVPRVRPIKRELFEVISDE